MQNTVSIVRCQDYNQELLNPALEEAVLLAGGLDAAGKKILVKPNLLSGSSPEKAVTTHPEFLRAIIRLLRKKGASSILVGDSPGYHPPLSAAKKAGLFQVVQEEDAEWIDFNSLPTCEIQGGEKVKNFMVTSAIKEVDLIISLPKMKTHQFMYYTGAMKNLFGLIPGVNKAGYHLHFPDRTHFAQMIVDLNLSLPEVFSIMDAVVAMEGPGPGSGYPRQTGLILASSNVLALDYCASTIMGYNPMEIPVLPYAFKTSRWLSSPEEIEVKGENLEDLIMKDFKRITVQDGSKLIRELVPQKFYRFLQQALVPVPVFSRKTCIACGECVAICPAKALKLIGSKESRHIEVDYHLCIRCYCCHEICPAKAITVKRKLKP